MTAQKPSDFVTVGKIGAAYGIKGWVKLISFTDPAKNILNYQSFALKDIVQSGQLDVIEIDQSRSQGKGFVGHIKGCDDRDKTRLFTGKELLIEKSVLPALTENDYYWYQLEGLTVKNLSGEELGVVDHLIGTGANDVLVVKPSTDSIDDEERLIPYLRDQIVKSIDLEEKLICLDWESDF